MEVVDIWTGRTANALRIALRMTNERFAEDLGTAVRTVAKWNAQPELVPVPELQRALDTALSRASEEEQARFARLAVNIPATQSGLPAIQEQGVRDALQWLDTNMQWHDGEARNRVGNLLRRLSEESFRNDGYRVAA